MASDDAIVDYENISIIVKMRMGVLLYLFAACSPSCVPDTDVSLSDGVGNLVDQSINTVHFLIWFLGPFDHLDIHLLGLPAEGDDARTVVASVFKELYSQC